MREKEVMMSKLLCGSNRRKQRRFEIKKLPLFQNSKDIGSLQFIRHYSSKEIARATFRFSTIIGNDPHRNIYKARFPDGLVATVRTVGESQDSSNAFYREVELLSRIYHRHIVRLRGFSEGRDRFLVFDYMENGSLKDCLQDPLKTPLSWRTRLQVAISVAAALEYLYFFSDLPVHNISIASTNVFLDENFVAKICYFGLLGGSRHVHEPDTACSKGFICPKKGHVIFQFGALILELITGQSFASEGEDLIRWVQDSRCAFSMHKMVDADLGENYDPKELKSLLTVARLCTRVGEYPTISIRQILRYLQKKAEVQPSTS